MFFLPGFEEDLVERGHVRLVASRSEDEESHEICIKPAWSIGEVKRWMCIRLPCLRRAARRPVFELLITS